jgi:hypothetical protein
MKGGNRQAGTIFRSQFGARFAPSRAERQVGETGARPSTLGRGSTHCKLLKTERLQVFQFNAKMPSFRQATDW